MTNVDKEEAAAAAEVGRGAKKATATIVDASRRGSDGAAAAGDVGGWTPARRRGWEILVIRIFILMMIDVMLVCTIPCTSAARAGRR